MKVAADYETAYNLEILYFDSTIIEMHRYYYNIYKYMYKYIYIVIPSMSKLEIHFLILCQLLILTCTAKIDCEKI